MIDRFRLSSMLPRKLEELGLVPGDVLRLAGLPPGLFQAERVLVTTEELFAFYRGLAQAGDAAIGLRLGTENRLERYSAVALAAVSSRSLRDSLERLARYKQLTCPEAIELTERGDEGRVRFKWLLAQETEPAVLIDVCFAAVVSTARRGTGDTVNPKRIELRRESLHAAMYAGHFGCPIVFGARHNVIVFHEADLDRPFLTHNADLLAVVAPQLEAELQSARRFLCGARRPGEELAQASPGRQAAGPRRCRARARDEHADASAQADRGRGDLPAPAAGRPARARSPLPPAFIAGAERDCVPAGLRGQPFVLPRLPAMGRHVPRRMARPTRRAVARHAGRGSRTRLTRKGSHEEERVGKERSRGLGHRARLHGDELRLRSGRGQEGDDRAHPDSRRARRHVLRHRRGVRPLPERGARGRGARADPRAVS